PSRSVCTSAQIEQCIISTLRAATLNIRCQDRAYCHAGSAAHTWTTCGFLKSRALTTCPGAGIRLPAWMLSCVVCPPDYARPGVLPPGDINLGGLDPSAVTIFLCRRDFGRGNVDASPTNGGIAAYCADRTTQRLLVDLMVHEASHACVGGHDTTRPYGP